MKNKLNELVEIQEQIKKLYVRKNELENDIKRLFNESGINTLRINKNSVAVLKTMFEKQIDYDKLKEQYPEIYKQGLMTNFSISRALKSVDKKLLFEAIDNCKKTVKKEKLFYPKRKEI